MNKPEASPKASQEREENVPEGRKEQEKELWIKASEALHLRDYPALEELSKQLKTFAKGGESQKKNQSEQKQEGAFEQEKEKLATLEHSLSSYIEIARAVRELSKSFPGEERVSVRYVNFITKFDAFKEKLYGEKLSEADHKKMNDEFNLLEAAARDAGNMHRIQWLIPLYEKASKNPKTKNQAGRFRELLDIHQIPVSPGVSFDSVMDQVEVAGVMGTGSRMLVDHIIEQGYANSKGIVFKKPKVQVILK